MTDGIDERFIDDLARLAIVRLSNTECVVASGFFVTADGFLLTAHHSFRFSLARAEHVPDEFYTFEVDVASFPNGPPGAPGAIILERTLTARTRKSWINRDQDWAILKFDFTPAMCLPIGSIESASVRAKDLLLGYGFALGQQIGRGISASQCSIVHIDYSADSLDLHGRPFGRGHSGGPLYHVKSNTVIGLTLGGCRESTDKKDRGLGCHLKTLLETAPAEMLSGLKYATDEWRRKLMQAVAEGDRTFPTSLEPIPPRPQNFVIKRSLTDTCLGILAKDGVVALHGVPGSGKTTLAAALTESLREELGMKAVFWHDCFLQASVEPLIRLLALFLVRETGDFDPLYRCLNTELEQANDEIVEALAQSIARGLGIGRCVICLDNLHEIQRVGDRRVRAFLNTLIESAVNRGARFVLCSWDLPDFRRRIEAVPTLGFNREEVRDYMRQCQFDLADPHVDEICNCSLSRDIVALDIFLRLWRLDPDLHLNEFLSDRPPELRTYLWTKYTKYLSYWEHIVLSLFAIFEEPIRLKLAAAICPEDGNFSAALNKLLTSPPLLEFAKGGRFSMHLILRQTILESMPNKVRLLRETAAKRLLDQNEFLLSASQFYEVRQYEAALDLLQTNARTILERGEYNAILRLIEKLEVAIGQNRVLVGKLHHIKGTCRHISGDYAGAIGSYALALDALPDDDVLELKVLNHMADTYRQSSRYEDAQKCYGKVILRAKDGKALEQETEHANALLGSAKIHRLACEYREAMDSYTHALSICESLNHRNGIFESHFGLGEVSRLRHNFEEALVHYEDSQRETKRNNCENLRQQAYALWGIGEVARLREQFGAAEKTHTEGLKLCQQICEPRDEGWAHMGLAEISRMTAKLDEAERRYKDAVQLFRGIQSSTELAHAKLGLAETARCKGMADLSLYDEPESTYRARKLQHCIAMLLLGKSLAMKELGESADSINQALSEARAISQAHGLVHELRSIDLFQRSMSASVDTDGSHSCNPLNFP
jgi:tetratricopeptide (TPR) repeat protein